MKNEFIKVRSPRRWMRLQYIKMFGRDFVGMRWSEKIAGLYWCLAFCLLGCTDIDNSSTGANLAVFSNFFAACGVVIWRQRRESARGAKNGKK